MEASMKTEDRRLKIDPPSQGTATARQAMAEHWMLGQVALAHPDIGCRGATLGRKLKMKIKKMEWWSDEWEEPDARRMMRRRERAQEK
jgi:hypothetical protein